MKWLEKPVFQLCCLISSLLTPLSALAQSQPEMATHMRASGKIYVVVAVVVIIFLGVLAYLLLMERRLKKLEQDNAPAS